MIILSPHMPSVWQVHLSIVSVAKSPHTYKDTVGYTHRETQIQHNQWIPQFMSVPIHHSNTGNMRTVQCYSAALILRSIHTA